MDPKLFEAMLNDAEVRLRRLKMLYEQWFAGFERIEPAVARKEVDELLQRLRREQVRNTGLRFRLQQLVQRHTTFTTYWRRIARQIEEGTYQRDVLRAKKVRDHEPHDAAAPELSYDVEVDVDVGVEMDSALQAALREAEQAVAVKAAHATAAGQSAPAPTNNPAQLRDPGPSSVPATPTAPAKVANPAAPPEAERAAAQPAPKKLPPPPPPRASLGPRAISPFALPLPPIPGSGNSGAPRPPGSLPSAPPKPPSAAGLSANRPPPPLAAAATASLPPKAPAAPKTVVATPSADTRARPTTSGAGLSTDELHRIYERYLAARKQNAERTDNVKLETIEKSLRGMLPQLEKKHAGKKIDFEVVVKDGKVALKPVAK